MARQRLPLGKDLWMNSGSAFAGTRRPVTAVTCVGTPWEMGRAQGESERVNIREAIRAIEDLEAFHLMKPPYLPFGWFRRYAEFRAARFLKVASRAAPLAAFERLRGIADGSGVALSKLSLCGFLEALLSDLTSLTATGPSGLQAGCSAIAVTGASSATGSPLIVHNFDYLPMIQPFYLVRHSHPRGKLRSVEFSLSPLAGAVDGVNEAGVAVTCNYAYVTDSIKPAPTITMVISELLASATCVDEAFSILEATPRVGGGLLMLADAHGAIASVEISNSRVRRRDPAHEESRVYHTNRFQCEDMTPLEMPGDSTYRATAPRPLRGIRVHQSADERAKTIRDRLQQRRSFSLDDLQAIMADHGNGPAMDSVCMHSDYWYTTACMQLVPSEGKLRASFSTACSAQFQDFVCATHP